MLGIFGRLSSDQEAIFDAIESKYSKKPEGNEYNIFRHLTLSYIPNAKVSDIYTQILLLRDLKKFLPLKVKVKNVFIKQEESMVGAEHIAIEFDTDDTYDITNFIKSKINDSAVITSYIKLVWFVPRVYQDKVKEELSNISELEFADFYLVSNKQDEHNTIFRSSDF